MQKAFRRHITNLQDLCLSLCIGLQRMIQMTPECYLPKPLLEARGFACQDRQESHLRNIRSFWASGMETSSTSTLTGMLMRAQRGETAFTMQLQYHIIYLSDHVRFSS